MQRPRKLGVSSALIAITLVAAGCGGSDDVDGGSSAPGSAESPAPESSQVAAPDDWEAVVAAAEEEGQVTLYSAIQSVAGERLEEAFEAAYPEIDLVVQNLRQSETVSILDAERSTGTDGADVWIAGSGGLQAVGVWEEEDPADILEPMGPAVEAAADRIFGTELCTCALVLYTHTGLAWRTEEVPEGISTFEDVIDERFRGRIALTDANEDVYKHLFEHGGDDYLERLAELDPIFFSGSGGVREALTSGEAAVTVYGSASSFQDAMDDGSPVDWAPGTPETPAWSSVIGAAIFGWGNSPNAAQVLVDFMVTREGQQALAQQAVSPVFDDIEGTASTVAGVNVTGAEIMSAEERERVLTAFSDAFGRELICFTC